MIAVLFAALLIPCAAQEMKKGSIEHGGRTRTYLYYVPDGHAGKLPVIFGFHGAGGQADRMMATMRFQEQASKKGFIIVYPDGYQKNWNDGRNIPSWPAHQENVDDVGFVSALIDHFIARHNADAKRIYVTGISNGGLISHRLGCELSGKITAIAPVVRTLTVKMAAACRPAKPIPVLMFFGTADKLVPFEGGDQNIASVKVPTLSAKQTIDHWAERNGCTKRETREHNEIKRELRTACRSGADVMAYILAGGGHTWPKSGIDATNLILEFFRF